MARWTCALLLTICGLSSAQDSPLQDGSASASSAECVANITKLLEYFKEEFPKQVPDVIDIKGTGRKPGKSALLLIGFKETQLVTPERLECSNQTTVSFVVPIEGRAAIYLGAAVRPEVWRTYFKSTVKLAGTFNLLKGPSLDKIEVQKIALDKLQLLEAGGKDVEQPSQQFVARVCGSLLKTTLSKEVPAITQRAVQKSLADLQQTFINSSLAALEKRGIQIYKLLESMLKTNKDSSKSKDDAKLVSTQDLLTRKRVTH